MERIFGAVGNLRPNAATFFDRQSGAQRMRREMDCDHRRAKAAAGNHHIDEAIGPFEAQLLLLAKSL